MKRIEYFVKRANEDGDPVALSVLCVTPDESARFVVQILHGFTDKKERWMPFAEAVADAGGILLVHDRRGFGNTVRSSEELGICGDFGYHCETLCDDIDAVYASLAQMPENGALTEPALPEEPDTPDVPRYLLGFSSGALAAAIYASRRTKTLAGLILAGMPHRERSAGAKLLGMQILSLIGGESWKPSFLHRSVQRRYNRKFQAEPGSDGTYLWLSNDIGNRFTVSLDPAVPQKKSVNAYENYFRLLRDTYRPSSWDIPRPNLPILMMAGEFDPVAGGDKAVLDAVRFFRDIGFSSVEAKMYRGMRHEIFRDAGSEIPTSDAAAFCEEHLDEENDRLDRIRGEYTSIFSVEE